MTRFLSDWFDTKRMGKMGVNLALKELLWVLR